MERDAPATSKLLCDLGRHKPAPIARWNDGYYFTTCNRCGRDLVRTAFGKWQVPKGYKVVWQPEPPESRPNVRLVEDRELARAAAAGLRIELDAHLTFADERRLPKEPESAAAPPPEPEQTVDPEAEAVTEPEPVYEPKPELAIFEEAILPLDEEQLTSTEESAPADVDHVPAGELPIQEVLRQLARDDAEASSFEAEAPPPQPQPEDPPQRRRDFMKDDGFLDDPFEAEQIASWTAFDPTIDGKRLAEGAEVAAFSGGAVPAGRVSAEDRDSGDRERGPISGAIAAGLATLRAAARARLEARTAPAEEVTKPDRPASGEVFFEDDDLAEPPKESDADEPAEAVVSPPSATAPPVGAVESEPAKDATNGASTKKLALVGGSALALVIIGTIIAGALEEQPPAPSAPLVLLPPDARPATNLPPASPPSAQASAPTTASPSPTERSGQETVYVAARLLNCRTAPAREAASVRKLERGEGVQVIAREGDWASIAHDGRQCWASARFLSQALPL